MSYLPVRHWWMKPLNLFAKCQSLTLNQQINIGVVLYDLRIEHFKNSWIFAHGLVKYKGLNIYDVLHQLNNLNKPIHVRLILENINNDDEIKKFQFLCWYISINYKNIIIYECRLKSTWEVLVVGSKTMIPIQLVQSMQKPLLMIPKLYTLFFNKSNMKKINKDPNLIYLIDFIK